MSTRSTYTNVVVREDSTGERIAIRPRELLAQVDGRNAAASTPARLATTIESAIRKAFPGVCGPKSPPRVTVIRRLRGGSWAHLAVSGVGPGFEILDLLDELRRIGLAVQPDHVYFVATLGSAGRVAPNTFTPNTFTPNTFTPNTFTGGGWLSGVCCDDCADPVDPVFDVPQLAARPVIEPFRRGAATVRRQRVDVHVIDIATPGTGNRTRLTGEYNRTSNTGRPDVAAVDENGDRFADPATGHGDFIRSIIGLECGITAKLWQAADAMGEISDGDLIDAIEDVVRGSKHDGTVRVLNLSLSGYHTGVDPDEQLLRQTITDLIEDDWVVVAAAGNDAGCRPAMPAALDGVVSVGALGPCGPAPFSNYGSWVDVSAPGVNVVAEWPDLAGRCDDSGAPLPNSDLAMYGGLTVGNGQDPHRPEEIRPLTLGDFDTGWAFWSGTSFSTPLVVSRIARRIHDTADGATSNTELIDDAIHHVIRRDDHPWHPHYGRLLT